MGSWAGVPRREGRSWPLPAGGGHAGAGAAGAPVPCKGARLRDASERFRAICESAAVLSSKACRSLSNAPAGAPWLSAELPRGAWSAWPR
eukprot:5469256-Heterocapsa_arctica.AAC.1